MLVVAHLAHLAQQREGLGRELVANEVHACLRIRRIVGVVPRPVIGDRHKLWGVDTDVIVDPDSIVEIDDSEAVPRRLTDRRPRPASPSLRWRGLAAQHRSTSTSTMGSTSYVAVKVNAWGVNDQVDVDDHDGEDRSARDEEL